MRCERLKRIANKEHIALLNSVRVEDRAARIEAVGEGQRRTVAIERSPCEQGPGPARDRLRSKVVNAE